MKPWHILIAVAAPGAMAALFIAQHRSHSAEMAKLRADLTTVSKAQAEDRRSTSRRPELQPMPARPSMMPADAPAPAATATEDVPVEPANSPSGADRRRTLEPAEVQQRLEGRFIEERADA